MKDIIVLTEIVSELLIGRIVDEELVPIVSLSIC
jgi:hypothetical protein